MIKVRKLLNSQTVLIYLLLTNPQSEFIEYWEKGSDDYESIVSFCKIPQGLYPVSLKGYNGDNILKTKNGIFYDKRKDAFAELDIKFLEVSLAPNIHNIFPKEIFQGSEEIIFDVMLYKEDMFPQEDWDNLQKLGAFTNVFEVEERFLEYGVKI